MPPSLQKGFKAAAAAAPDPDELCREICGGNLGPILANPGSIQQHSGPIFRPTGVPFPGATWGR